MNDETRLRIALVTSILVVGYLIIVGAQWRGCSARGGRMVRAIAPTGFVCLQIASDPAR